VRGRLGRQLVGVGAAIALLVAAAPAARAKPDPPPLGNQALTDQALDLEAKVVDHLWYGQIHGVTFDSPAHLPGHVIGLHGGGDSGLWSGVYLAGQAFRYAVARHALAQAHGTKNREAAQAELDAAKARVDELVWSAHRRINISANWEPEPADPSRSPQDGGLGGVVHGEAGAAFRACFPAGVPSWQQDQSNRPNYYVFGPMAWDDNGDGVNDSSWYCEDASSRDTYAGTTFGLLTALDLVGSVDARLRQLIGADLMLMTDYLVRHGWSVVRPHTRISTEGSENFIFPLFVINPIAQLNMTQSARRAAQVMGTAADKAKWEAIWTAELLTQGPGLLPEALFNMQNFSSYYSFNLDHLTYFDTIREETNPVTRRFIAQNFAISDATTRDDINAHFEALTYGLTGEPARRQLAIQHLTDWRGYRATSEQNITNSTRCGKGLACVGEDAITLVQPTPLGPLSIPMPVNLNDPASVATPSTKLRAADPLPVMDRVRHEDFLWQRSPFKLDGGFNPYEREPGVDFLTPYWMLRYYTEVAPPTLAPLPPWVGPVAR
jgi:hypothetical protein